MPATAIALVAMGGFLARAQAPAPAEPAAAAAPEGPTPAEQFLDVAIAKIHAMERVSSTILQTVDMLNQKFQIKGEYYKDTGYRVRLKLDLSGLGGTDATMLQISDGKTLWDYQKVLSAPSYTKRELGPILERLKNPNLDPAFRELVVANMGFGGPEALLMGFRKYARFDQLRNDTEDGRAVVIIGGTWTNREKLLGPGDQPLSPTAPLPPYVPSNIQITLGAEDHWPYRIKMIGNAPSILSMQEDTRKIGQDGRPIGVKRPPPKINPSTVTLEYGLKPDAAIDPALFSFQAPTDAANPPKDDTELFLSYLDNSIMVETERKKAEAAKQEGEPATLKDSLIIPKGDPGDGTGLGILPKPSPTPTPEPAAPK
ncbi:hypothetical protein TA3x_003412 [Tundrisphaera sp. TA3]|uniref:hypothetical protein n=1 Tax=Tundrisphaera sp. TA3 TaxID=3435775 RepID=UPI003EC0AFC4